MAANLERLVESYETGVLTLRILVAESAKPRKVQITEGADDPTIEAQTTPGQRLALIASGLDRPAPLAIVAGSKSIRPAATPSRCSRGAPGRWRRRP